MKKKWINKYDKMIIGIILGFIFPIIGFFVSYLLNGSSYSFSEYCYDFIRDDPHSVLSEVYSENRINALSICLIANMLLFYLTFFIFKLNNLSKGLVGMTILLAALTFIFI